MSCCFIQFDSPEIVYYPGRIVTGRVICSFTESKQIRGIKLKFRGEEYNRWSGTETYYDHHERRNKTRTVHYSGQNTIFVVKNVLAGEGSLGPGRFDYAFSFQLPQNIPSSYQGRYGGIYYSITAKVDRPFKTDFTDSKQIVIHSPINLNEMLHRLQLGPVAYSDYKSLCCCCYSRGNITMEVHLEKQAFSPGDVAKVKVNVTNMSKVNIEKVVVKIGMTVKSIVTYPTTESKYDFQLLAMAKDSGVGAHGEKTCNFELLIPESVTVPNFSLCSLFNQRSTIEVTAAVPSPHKNMKIVADITMGHIPIASVPNQQAIYVAPESEMAFAAATAGPSAPISEDLASAPSKTEMAEAPPSYNEAVGLPPKA